MISAGELAQMRTEANRTLPESCAVQSPTNTPTADGEYNKSFATTATVACRTSPSSYQQAEREVGGAIAAQASWVITLPFGTSVPADARILCNGVTYEIIGSSAGRSYGVLVRVYAGQVNG